MKKPTRAGLEVAVSSEKGLRDENQDWLSWTQIPRGELFIVADGMGGYSGGQRASRMTVEGIEKYLVQAPETAPFPQALQDAVSRTNLDVHRAANSGDPDTQNMGSTVVVALVANAQVQVGHVGDSRAYLYRKRQLRRLTKDHTRVQEMLDAGILTPEQARTHPEGHLLSRAVGTRPDIEVEVAEPVPLIAGDGLLLCSDGLTGYVDDERIRKTLQAQRHVQEIPAALVALALASGGSDNITVQFVRIGRQPHRAATVTGDAMQRGTAPMPALTTLRIATRSGRVAKMATVSASLVGVAVVTGAFWLRQDDVKSGPGGALPTVPAVRSAPPPPANGSGRPPAPPAPAASSRPDGTSGRGVAREDKAVLPASPAGQNGKAPAGAPAAPTDVAPAPANRNTTTGGGATSPLEESPAAIPAKPPAAPPGPEAGSPRDAAPPSDDGRGTPPPVQAPPDDAGDDRGEPARDTKPDDTKEMKSEEEEGRAADVSSPEDKPEKEKGGSEGAAER